MGQLSRAQLRARALATKELLKHTGPLDKEKGNLFGTGFNMGWNAHIKHLKHEAEVKK